MRIYEIFTEYARGKDRCVIYERFRVACETFAEAFTYAQKKTVGKRLMIRSIEIVADTRL